MFVVGDCFRRVSLSVSHFIAIWGRGGPRNASPARRWRSTVSTSGELTILRKWDNLTNVRRLKRWIPLFVVHPLDGEFLKPKITLHNCLTQRYSLIPPHHGHLYFWTLFPLNHLSVIVIHSLYESTTTSHNRFNETDLGAKCNMKLSPSISRIEISDDDGDFSDGNMTSPIQAHPRTPLQSIQYNKD